MKNYEVSVNINKRFENANYADLGKVRAKSKKQAAKLVYEAIQGVDNEAEITVANANECISLKNKDGRGFRVDIVK